MGKSSHGVPFQNRCIAPAYLGAMLTRVNNSFFAPVAIACPGFSETDRCLSPTANVCPSKPSFCDDCLPGARRASRRGLTLCPDLRPADQDKRSLNRERARLYTDPSNTHAVLRPKRKVASVETACNCVALHVPTRASARHVS